MSDNNSNQDANKYLFINLVTMLSITAMQQLGKVINPVIGKADVNLEAAQATIDTLDMLAAKTEGKLDQDEERLLKDTLATLKMNYVETRDEEGKKAQRDKVYPPVAPPQATRGTKAQSSGEQPTSPEPPAPEKSEAKPEKEPPKFHKSYS